MPRIFLSHAAKDESLVEEFVDLLHVGIGVHPDDVMTDYVLTNAASRLDERIASGAFEQMPRYSGLDAETVRALWGVDAEYLATAFAAVAAQHGSVEDYAEAVLGVDGAARAALRAAYLSA